MFLIFVTTRTRLAIFLRDLSSLDLTEATTDHPVLRIVLLSNLIIVDG